MISKENNYAFIDSQNVNLSIKELGWSLDFKKFRVYLHEKYGVTKAYLFIGYVPENQDSKYPALLKKTAKEKLLSMNDLAEKLKYASNRAVK